MFSGPAVQKKWIGGESVIRTAQKHSVHHMTYNTTSPRYTLRGLLASPKIHVEFYIHEEEKKSHPIPCDALALLSQLLVEERVEPVELDVSVAFIKPLTVIVSYFLGVVVHDGIIHKLHRPQRQQVMACDLHSAHHLVRRILVSQSLHKLP